MGIRNRLRFAAVTTVVVASLAQSPANADSVSGGPPSSGVQVTYSLGAPPGVQEAAANLAPGQSSTSRSPLGYVTATVVTPDACTESITANSPTKVSKNGGYAAQGKVVYYVSSGCSQTEYPSTDLNREACGTFGCNWRIEEYYSGTVKPGQTVTVTVWRMCGNNNSDRWSTDGSFSGVGSTTSAAVWLNCGE